MDYCELPPGRAQDTFPDPDRDLSAEHDRGMAVLAGGCFWCTEAVYKAVAGVREVSSGYTGGSAETANYDSVCSGQTDHAEAIRVYYDPDAISYGQLLKLFFSVAHDPTQLNRQGNDRGRQYRSAIFPADENQQAVAEAYLRQLEQSGIFSAPIVTTIEPLGEFYEAEAYHQSFVERNPGQPYVAHVAVPKVEKLRAHYPRHLRGRDDAP